MYFLYIHMKHTHVYMYTQYLSLFLIVHAHASGMPEASSLQLGFRAQVVFIMASG